MELPKTVTAVVRQIKSSLSTCGDPTRIGTRLTTPHQAYLVKWFAGLLVGSGIADLATTWSERTQSSGPESSLWQGPKEAKPIRCIISSQYAGPQYPTLWSREPGFGCPSSAAHRISSMVLAPLTRQSRVHIMVKRVQTQGQKLPGH